MTDTIPELIEKILAHDAMTDELRARLLAGHNVGCTRYDEWKRNSLDAFCLRCGDWLWEKCHEISLCALEDGYAVGAFYNNTAIDGYGPTKNHARLSAMLAALDAKGGE